MPNVEYNFNMVSEPERENVIKVIGVGGAGCNAINRMVESGMTGVEFISMNTDYQVLNQSKANVKLNIGVRLTRGKGCGGNSSVGQKAAEESREEISAAIKGADMVFITCGEGGGTGTGAAPVLAQIAKEMGILTVAVVTKPFLFERKARMDQAERGISALKEHVDSLLVIPNERLRTVSNEPITLLNAFALADDVLQQGVKAISEIINTSALVNLDFNDVTSVMKDAGFAHMGTGYGKGEGMAKKAAEEAINSPLLETKIDGARGVIVNFNISPSTSLEDVYSASDMIAQAVSPDANYMWGVNLDQNLDNEMRITVIATGFDRKDTLQKKFGFEESSATKLNNILDGINNANPDKSSIDTLNDILKTTGEEKREENPIEEFNFSGQQTFSQPEVETPNFASEEKKEKNDFYGFDDILSLLKKK